MNIPDKLKSRKLWVAVITGLVPILNEALGWHLDSQAILSAVGLGAAYIAVEGVADVVSRTVTKQAEPISYDPALKPLVNIANGRVAYSNEVNQVANDTVLTADQKQQKVTELGVKYRWLFDLEKALAGVPQ